MNANQVTKADLDFIVSQLTGSAPLDVSVNRLGRFRKSDVLRHLFERVVAACMTAGLVKGEGFAVDASVIEANASRYHGKAPNELDWSDAQRQQRAVAEYLASLAAEARHGLRTLMILTTVLLASPSEG